MAAPRRKPGSARGLGATIDLEDRQRRFLYFENDELDPPADDQKGTHPFAKRGRIHFS
jgi:hypothetical protein